MFKTLSKSVFIMFIFDLLILFLSTLMWAYKFSYSAKAIIFLTLSVVVVGLIVLFLKGNYKIREFNITGKNTYLLFEGIVMMHVIPALYLFIFASSVGVTIEFLFANILTTFVCLRIYRALFHLYLFKIKKTKNMLILGTDKRASIVGQPKRELSDTKCEYFNFAFS